VRLVLYQNDFIKASKKSAKLYNETLFTKHLASDLSFHAKIDRNTLHAK